MYRKITMLFMFLIVAALFVILKPSFPRSFHHFMTPSTNLQYEKIMNLHLYDNVNDEKFVNRFGEQTITSQDNDLYNYYEIQDGVEIATNDKGDILRFMIQTGIPTVKGIEVGDSIQKAMDLYGNRYYKRMEQGVTIIGYVDKKHNQSLELWCDSKNKIILYRLDDNSME